MGWIRKTAEPLERRPSDVAVLLLATFLTVLTGLWAEAHLSVDHDIAGALSNASDEFHGVARAFFALGSIWAVVAVSVVLIALRFPSVALRVAAGGGLAWALAALLHVILPSHATQAAGASSAPTFPSANVAVIAAVAVVLVPYAVRGLRRVLLVLIVLVALSAVLLGEAYAPDVIGGLFLGIAAGALVLVAFGSPAGRLTLEEIRAALVDMGYDIADLGYSSQRIARASVADVSLASGERVRVDAFGRDQRDAQLFSKFWRAAMYREPSQPVFGSRLQQVEHVAYVLMLADRAGVCVPHLVRTGVGGAKAAMLVTTMPEGCPLADLTADQASDDVLRAVWSEVHRLHGAGIAHGHLDSSRIVISETGAIAFTDFSAADATGTRAWLDRDDASVIVDTALIAGNDRAVAAAVDALGKERIAEVIPVVQPAALPRETVHGADHLGKKLKELRTELAAAAGVDDVPTLKIKRLTWINVGMMLGVLLALGIAVHSLKGFSWDEVKGEYEQANWAWVALAAMLYPLIPIAWATALIGCVNADLPFTPTGVMQNACAFLNLITPNGIGGTALQVGYLHKQGIPLASAGSAMVLSTGVGGLVQVILLVIALTLTATSVDTKFNVPSAGQVLLLVAVVAAVAGIVLRIPKVKGKVVPQVTRAARDIWSVVRNPTKALLVFGGNLAGNLLYPLLLGLCLLAVGQKLDYASLVVVQFGANMLGSAAPVPGGIGVQEAVLTAGLTSFGVPSNPAVAAVILFRAITFAIPPVFGFFSLRWLRGRGYV